MERWLRDIENFLVASDRFEEETDGKNFDLIRKAVERMKPKKPILYDGFHRRACPVCDMPVDGKNSFCNGCGQALDWSEK